MANRLQYESSPYLRSHADNPVDWYPWGEEAFEKARRENRPVFLSIGYSTCHWCHIMARESFEDEGIASILNENYVSVKVDREERPDVDSVYMAACVAANGSGGWPLTAILTPEQEPFFVGTYFPKESRGGRMGLRAILLAIAQRWQRGGGELRRTALEMTAWLKRETAQTQAENDPPQTAAEQLLGAYDAEYGGFGTAPKFPAAHNLLFLLPYAALRGDKKAREAAENTLRQMYRGGIYDHIGGGFCRYSTDREWLKPHFEKTLYDNALLALAYTEAWRDGHLPLWRQAAEDTLDYCLRELKDAAGGFCCGQDADSGGAEGAYYLFTPDEVTEVLGPEAGKPFCECYDITKDGNFEGKSIPNLLLNTRWNLLPEGYDSLREKLRLYRAERMALFTDRKLLSGWNGLLLMALARAARVFSDRRYLNEARELAAFLLGRMYKDGRLYRCLCEGRLRFDAGLDDYAFCALGLLELYDADFDPAHIEDAARLAAALPERFADEKGGFFSTAADSEELLLRPKESGDGALPCGNSAAALLFARLFALTGAEEWRALAQKQADFIAAAAGPYPAGSCYGMLPLLLRQHGTREIVCVLPGERLPDSLETIRGRYAPEVSLLLKTPARAGALAEIAPFTAAMEAKDGKATYYICSGGVCGLPVTEEGET
ncbi:MAG: thioredoxin domain-containing protein [Oscillospiraceae bacterium]|nr:thioredoxin domain-containing protein [Oscillospiraceae bacterium]